MNLLKEGVPFIWDDNYQCSFDSLKTSLMSTQLLSPSNYTWEFLLYLAASESTIGMVLTQEQDPQQESTIYYLRIGFVGPEIRYTHVEMMYLECIHVVQ